MPIILLTAKGEARDRIEGLELGADDYLGKPFEPKELLLRIKNILSKVLQRLIYKPYLCNRVVETLATQKELSSLLVGVIGDYLPANKVVCFQYLLRLLGGMLSHRQLSFLPTKYRPPTKEF